MQPTVEERIDLTFEKQDRYLKLFTSCLDLAEVLVHKLAVSQVLHETECKALN